MGLVAQLCALTAVLGDLFAFHFSDGGPLPVVKMHNFTSIKLKTEGGRTFSRPRDRLNF